MFRRDRAVTSGAVCRDLPSRVNDSCLTAAARYSPTMRRLQRRSRRHRKPKNASTARTTTITPMMVRTLYMLLLRQPGSHDGNPLADGRRLGLAPRPVLRFGRLGE
jgi:hypothetical protein